MPFTPTPEQAAILAHHPGRHARVLAGPGTGKSATLVALVSRLLEEIPPPRIKLVTFTRAATGELAKKVSQHPAAAAERPSTIHSFAISVLLRNSGSADFPIPLRIADKWEYKKVVRATLAKVVQVKIADLERLVQEMGANWQSLRVDQDPQIDPEIRARFLGAWGEHRRVYGYTLLDELPYRLRGALRDHPNLQGVDYDLLIVDEYQDLNACDLDVLRFVAERGCSLFAAGDDDQSIYLFRKAAPEGIRNFPQRYPGCADYPLSVTQRCGRRIMEWATHVIEGDTGRPRKPRLTTASGSPDGEVALLSFENHAHEAWGIASIVDRLVNREHVEPAEILVLFRTDDNGRFSSPIKQYLRQMNIPCFDPEIIERMLAEPSNRFLLEVCRLLINQNDSISWGALLLLTKGIGDAFSDYVYTRAVRDRDGFGLALLNLHRGGFPDGPRGSTTIADDLIQRVLPWLEAHRPPDEVAGGCWGQWITHNLGHGDDTVSAPTPDFVNLLRELDQHAEEDQGFDRYLSQISPLGRDLALAQREGVRIMRMAGAKGLTVRATIIGAAEEGLVPRPGEDLAEERRLLYVGMTRPREFLYCTWARVRYGPTARAGEGQVNRMRHHSTFLEGGPVESQDGAGFIASRWP